jgi:PAS domain S-box-containing protein
VTGSSGGDGSSSPPPNDDLANALVHILLVEDSPEDAELTVRLLRAAGLHPYVRRVDNEVDFLEALDGQPDVIISDLDLPDFDGLRALVLRGEHAPWVPFIVVSGAVSDEQAAAIMAQGATDYILKDRMGRLAQAVTQSLPRRASPAELADDGHEPEDRRRAEAHVQHASEYARSLIEASLDPLVTISPDGKITDMNLATVKVTGVSRVGLRGTDFSDYFTEPAQARRAYERTFAEESVTDYPLTIRHQDGTLTDVMYNASLYRDAAGEVLGVFAAARDVTAQKEAEAYFRGLLEGAPDAIVVVDRDGVIRVVNRQTEALFGYARDEILGETVEVLVPDQVRERHPAFRRAFGYETDSRPMGIGLELRARRRDGSEFPVEVSLAPVETPQGTYVAAAVRDVTFQHQAKAEVVRATQAKSDFLSRMSHELRTPLNAILGFGQLLDMDDLDAAQRDSVDHIIGAGEHLLGLIDEVLDISTVESGAMRLSLEPVYVRDVIDEAVGMLHPLADRRRVSIEVEVLGPRVHVQADRQRLKQAVVNLLANAVKYNRDDGEVRITSEPLDTGRLRLTVKDTGIGIAEGDLGRLFQPFERLSTAPDGVEGTGLGLALTKHLVSAMGGAIGVISSPGEGTSFWVELPIVEAPSEDRRETSRRLVEPPPPSPSGPKTVLYVEDNLSNVRLVERVIARRPDVTLMVAMQGRLALELAVEHRPDLILLDLHLPDLSGQEVLWELKQDPRTAATPVVVLSADATPGHPDRLLADGAADYLTKPFDIPRLLAVIDTLGTTRRPSTAELDRSPNSAMVATLHGLEVDSDNADDDEDGSVEIRTFVHDFNNLLGVVLNYCALLAAGTTDPTVATDLGEIRTAAERAVALTDQLLTPGGSHDG